MTCYACQHNNSNSQNYDSLKFVCKFNIHFLWYPPTFSQSRLGNTNSSKYYNFKTCLH